MASPRLPPKRSPTFDRREPGDRPKDPVSLLKALHTVPSFSANDIFHSTHSFLDGDEGTGRYVGEDIDASSMSLRSTNPSNFDLNRSAAISGESIYDEQDHFRSPTTPPPNAFPVRLPDGRTIYLADLPSRATVDDLWKLVEMDEMVRDLDLAGAGMRIGERVLGSDDVVEEVLAKGVGGKGGNGGRKMRKEKVLSIFLGSPTSKVTFESKETEKGDATLNIVNAAQPFQDSNLATQGVVSDEFSAVKSQRDYDERTLTTVTTATESLAINIDHSSEETCCLVIDFYNTLINVSFKIFPKRAARNSHLTAATIPSEAVMSYDPTSEGNPRRIGNGEVAITEVISMANTAGQSPKQKKRIELSTVGALIAKEEASEIEAKLPPDAKRYNEISADSVHINIHLPYNRILPIAIVKLATISTLKSMIYPELAAFSDNLAMFHLCVGNRKLRDSEVVGDIEGIQETGVRLVLKDEAESGEGAGVKAEEWEFLERFQDPKVTHTTAFTCKVCLYPRIECISCFTPFCPTCARNSPAGKAYYSTIPKPSKRWSQPASPITNWVNDKTLEEGGKEPVISRRPVVQCLGCLALKEERETKIVIARRRANACIAVLVVMVFGLLAALVFARSGGAMDGFPFIKSQ
ncbi:hypothetical protein HDU67_005502 [Dinochytrium kinnereticum]|nr:hypothetical protein HDU67_005502 [Dinochytrium kinnereticum]